jgi:NurA domain
MAKTAQQQKGIFETVLSNSRNISATYYNDLVLQRELSDDPAAFDDLLHGTRQRMQANGGVRQISTTTQAAIDHVERLHKAGQIAAVDGTDAISPTESMSKTVYAVGVISTTAQTLHDPHIEMTESHRRIPHLAKDEDFFAFIDRLDGWVDQDHSWVRTFREYCERKEALRLIDEDDMPLVLVDGPLYTQNLLTQSLARNGILGEMQQHSDRLIGFIKDLHSSKIMHLAGMALQPDEYWTVSSWRDLLARRFANDKEKTQWIDKARTDWVRTIYRKNAKAFAFECHPDLIDTGVALIASQIACAAIINHEIPFLLHCADRIVQARVNAAAKSENLISNSPYYANLANERAFR